MSNLKRKITRRSALGVMGLSAVAVPTLAYGQVDFEFGPFSTRDVRNVGSMLKGLSLNESDEIRLGNDYFGHLVDAAGGAYANRAVQRDMDVFASSLFRTSTRTNFSWEVAVIDDDSINAWALPGGKVGVNKGLLRYVANEHELAAALAHEIGHVDKSHALSEMKKKSFASGLSGAASSGLVAELGGDMATAASFGASVLAGPLLNLVTSGYAKQSEKEADLYIGEVFAKTGHDVGKGAQFYQMLLDTVPKKSKGRTSLFGGHPDTKKRLKAVLEMAAGRTGMSSTPAAGAFSSLKGPFPTRYHYLRGSG